MFLRWLVAWHRDHHGSGVSLWLLHSLAANKWLAQCHVVDELLAEECQRCGGGSSQQSAADRTRTFKRIQTLALGLSSRRGTTFCAAERVFRTLCCYWFFTDTSQEVGRFLQEQHFFQQLFEKCPFLLDRIPKLLHDSLRWEIPRKFNGTVVVTDTDQHLLLGRLLNMADPDGQTALHYSLRQFCTWPVWPVWAHHTIIQFYLNHGAKINARDKAGNTPLLLMLAQKEWFSQTHQPLPPKLMKDILKEVVDTLLEAGADIQAVNAKGESALTLLCHDYVWVKRLLNLGVSAADLQGRKALILATMLGCTNSVYLLLKAHVGQLGGLAVTATMNRHG